MQKFSKYLTNLSHDGGRVYSYGTHVATRNGRLLDVFEWYSVTTSKHVNFVANEWGLQVRKLYELPEEERQKILEFYPENEKKLQEQRGYEGEGAISAIPMISAFMSLISPDRTPKEVNEQDKRFLMAAGATFPDDWDSLPTEEQRRRLDWCFTELKK